MNLPELPKPRLSDYRDLIELWPFWVGILAITAAAPFLWDLFGL